MRDFSMSRRSFLVNSAVGVALASALPSSVKGQDKPKIQGFDETDTAIDPKAKWEPFTDRKLRIGIADTVYANSARNLGCKIILTPKWSP